MERSRARVVCKRLIIENTTTNKETRGKIVVILAYPLGCSFSNCKWIFFNVE